MKRQSGSLGVLTLWEADLLDVNPFDLPIRYVLRRRGIINRLFYAQDEIVISRYSILFRNYCFGSVISQNMLKTNQFKGVSIRVSPIENRVSSYAVSVNLHHEYEHFSVPLHFAFDMDLSSARLQSWSQALRLPILIPSRDGTWQELCEGLGKLKIKPTISRKPMQTLGYRKSLITHRRTNNPFMSQSKFHGNEITSWE